MNMADKINVLMKIKNIKNPKELSKKLNNQNLKIPYTTLLTIINNEVQDIKLGTARKLCTFFNITLDELLDDNIELCSINNNVFNIDGLDENDIEEIKALIEFKRNKKQKDK